MKRAQPPTNEEADGEGDGGEDDSVETYVPVHQRRLNRIKAVKKDQAAKKGKGEHEDERSKASVPQRPQESLLDIAITQGRLNVEETIDPAATQRQEEKEIVEVIVECVERGRFHVFLLLSLIAGSDELQAPHICKGARDRCDVRYGYPPH